MVLRDDSANSKLWLCFFLRAWSQAGCQGRTSVRLETGRQTYFIPEQTQTPSLWHVWDPLFSREIAPKRYCPYSVYSKSLRAWCWKYVTLMRKCPLISTPINPTSHARPLSLHLIRNGRQLRPHTSPVDTKHPTTHTYIYCLWINVSIKLKSDWL